MLSAILATLASNGLGLLVNAITTKGKEFVEDKIGIKIPEDSSQLTPDLIVKLKEAEMQHEETLINASIKKIEIEVENTKSARIMNSSIQVSKEASNLSKITPYILDIIIVISTLSLVAGLMIWGVPIGNKELIYMALGSLLTLIGTIVNFHRGTSSSSDNKNSIIRKLIGDK